MSLEQRLEELERRLAASSRFRQQLLYGLGVAFVCCGLVGAAFYSNTPEEGGLEQKTEEGIVQRGMIIPYFREELPNDKYVWADGKSKWPDKDWVPKHLRGKNIPDFTSRFPRGATGLSGLGEKGGADEHRHQLRNHHHKLPKTTGPISKNEGKINQDYIVIDKNGNAQGAHVFIAVDQNKLHLVDNWAKGKQPQGQHLHLLGGKTLGLAGDAFTSSDSNLPKYVAVGWIIRIK